MDRRIDRPSAEGPPTAAERDRLADPAWFPRHVALLDGIGDALEDLAPALRDATAGLPWPGGDAGPKLSRGWNRHGQPWRLLDGPRGNDAVDGMALVRSGFVQGTGWLAVWHLAGAARETLGGPLFAGGGPWPEGVETDLVTGPGNGDPWDYRPGRGNWSAPGLRPKATDGHARFRRWWPVDTLWTEGGWDLRPMLGWHRALASRCREALTGEGR